MMHQLGPALLHTLLLFMRVEYLPTSVDSTWTYRLSSLNLSGKSCASSPAREAKTDAIVPSARGFRAACVARRRLSDRRESMVWVRLHLARGLHYILVNGASAALHRRGLTVAC
jgi:hypothetical protein